MRRISYFLYYVFPGAYVLCMSFLEIFMTREQRDALYSEIGPVEIWQELSLLAGLCICVRLLCRLKPDQDKLLRIWIGLAFVGCLYTLGEEISWGQKFFHWNTPETWAEINGQGETNLHNTSHLLNQFPRAVLEVGILTAGLIIPALKKWAPNKLPQKFSVFYGGAELAPTAFLALTLKVVELTHRVFGFQVFVRKSEIIETLMYSFVLIYLISIYYKWKEERRLKA